MPARSRILVKLLATLCLVDLLVLIINIRVQVESISLGTVNFIHEVSEVHEGTWSQDSANVPCSRAAKFPVRRE